MFATFLAFQAKALENQEVLIREQRETKAILLNALSVFSKGNSTVSDGSRDPVLSCLPLKTEQELIEIETKLNNHTAFDSFVS